MKIDGKEITRLDQLILTMREIEGIKRQASDLQKQMLRRFTVCPVTRYRCIYGLLTGDCFSSTTANLLLRVQPAFVDSEDPSYRKLTVLEVVSIEDKEVRHNINQVALYITGDYPINPLVQIIERENGKLQIQNPKKE